MQSIGAYATARISRKQVVVCLLLCTFVFIGVIFFPFGTSGGVWDGLVFCGEILIPSLFPFMFLASFFVKSGLADVSGSMYGRLTEKIFRLPGATFGTVILGLVGGYPIGARGVKELYENGEINEEQAQRMMQYLVCAGPAFVISFIGAKIYNSMEIGVILFLSQLITAILLGVVSARFVKSERTQSIQKAVKPKKDFSASFVESCSDASKGMFSMCGMVILFSAFLGVLNSCGFSEIMHSILLCFNLSDGTSANAFPMMFEITKGCFLCLNQAVPVEFMAFAVGFGGICVHFQVFSILSSMNINKIKFILFRFVHGIIAAIITGIALRIFSPSEEVFGSYKTVTNPGISTSFIGSLALICMCICFLFSLHISKKPKSA
ncbi:MAG: hypothetical protein Q8876_05550 [Bacillota bacterium]|nr:hypothetical protein [Bacillota bacterium]